MAVWFNKRLIFSAFPIILWFGLGQSLENSLAPVPPHPFHVSVTEINHNAVDKTLEISCKLFADDFEKDLEKFFKTKVDLSKPVDRAATSKQVSDYIHRNLVIKADGRTVNFTAIGFEKDGDAIFAYFQADNIASLKKIEMTNTLLYDQFPDQIGIMHVVVGGNRKSTKLNCPEKEATVVF